MLDNTTRKRIDTARDILVGKVPDPKSQVEQITIALIYKFMDDMDCETEEIGGKATFFTGDFKHYSWSRLLDSKLGGYERLLRYAEGIEKMNMNKNIPQLFRDIFKGAFLPYRDPETLNLFLKEINGFTYDHSERLGDAFEYLLSIMSSQGNAGQFRTPRHIIDFIVEIVSPAKSDTILDPACGTAGFLISSYKHIRSENTKIRPGDLLTTDEKGRLMTNFCGYDISPDMVRLSMVNMYLHGFAGPKIYEYDTLTSEERWDERYDVILANPPFMTPKGGIRPHQRFSIKAKRSEVLFVDYIAEHLNIHGRAGVIVPEGIIFQSQNAYKNLRKMLVEEGCLYCVVSLPAGIFQPYSGVKTSILFMDKALAKKSDKILFVKVENDGFDLGAQRRAIVRNDLPEAVKAIKNYQLRMTNDELMKNDILQEKGDGGSGFGARNCLLVKKEKIAASGDYNLSGDRYREVVSYTHVKWPMVALGEVCENITKGTTPTTLGYNFTDNGINFVKIESISEEGMFIPAKFAHISSACHDKLKRSQLDENNLLFSIAGAFGRVAVVRKAILPANTNQALAIITLTKDVSTKYIFWILKSRNILEQIEKMKTGVAQYNISLGQVAKFLIPLPPLEMQEKIIAELDKYQIIIDGAKKVVENYKPIIKIDLEWPLVELVKLCSMEYGYTAKGEPKGDTRFIRITDISLNGELINDDPKYINLSNDSKPYLLKKADVLIARTGASYGKTIVFDLDKQCVFASFLIRLNFSYDKVLPEFFGIFSLTEFYWKQARDLVTGGGQPQFNANVIKKIHMPIPPLNIQKKIIAEIESERELVDANKKLIKIFEKKIRDKIREVWGEE